MAEASKPTQRDARLDVVRGFAIAGVVLVHVFRGMYAAGMVEYATTALVDRINTFWCLSVFAFVSGAFVPRGVRKQGVPAYVWDRMTQFFFVYVVWTVLQGGVQLLASSAINTPTSVGAMLSIWRPLGQLWYLPFLILVTLVFVPMQPWLGRRGAWILGATAVISFAFWGYDGGYVGTQGLGLVVFFVGGMVIGGERVKTALDRFTPATAAIVGVPLLIAGLAIGILTSAPTPTVFWDGRTVVATVVGIAVGFVTFAAVLLLGQTARSVGVLALLGRRSLDIYLAHITMASGTRIVLAHLGVTSIWLIAVLCFGVGVFGPVLLGTVLRRVKLGWIFDGPAWLTKIAPSSLRPAKPSAAGG